MCQKRRRSGKNSCLPSQLASHLRDELFGLSLARYGLSCRGTSSIDRARPFEEQ